jgi:NADH-quinone oxidoreductase subunit D
MVMEMDGEVVERIDPHIGLLHRGTEKLIEYKTYLQAMPYFDRLDYVSPMNQEHAFVLAVEKLAGVEVPLRAQYIRVLFSEITRIPQSPPFHSAYAMDVGAMTPFLWCFEQRELLMAFYERVSERGCMRPTSGSAACIRTCRRTSRRHTRLGDKFPAVLDDVENLLTDNRIFKQRTVDIGIVSQRCTRLGIHRPMLRDPACRGICAGHSHTMSMNAWNSISGRQERR